MSGLVRKLTRAFSVRCRSSTVTVTCVLALALNFASSARAAPARIDETLKRAETLATRGEAAAAIEIYRELVDRGLGSADIHYNLGTLYLESGELGRAALHLESALRDDPSHADARHNLDVLSSARRDEIEVIEPAFELVDDVGGALSPRVASLAFLVPFGLLLAALLLLAVVIEPRRRRRLQRVTRALTVVMLAGAAVLGVRVAYESVPRAVVIVDSTPARKAPAADAAVVLEAHAGLSGSVVADDGDYSRLRLLNGLELWVETRALAVVDGGSGARAMDP
jgi:hypothetical protein